MVLAVFHVFMNATVLIDFSPRLNRNNTLQKSKVPKKPAHLPKIAYLKAEQIPGFQKFQLHEVIRY